MLKVVVVKRRRKRQNIESVGFVIMEQIPACKQIFSASALGDEFVEASKVLLNIYIHIKYLNRSSAVRH